MTQETNPVEGTQVTPEVATQTPETKPEEPKGQEGPPKPEAIPPEVMRDIEGMLASEKRNLEAAKQAKAQARAEAEEAKRIREEAQAEAQRLIAEAKAKAEQTTNELQRANRLTFAREMLKDGLWDREQYEAYLDKYELLKPMTPEDIAAVVESKVAAVIDTKLSSLLAKNEEREKEEELRPYRERLEKAMNEVKAAFPGLKPAQIKGLFQGAVAENPAGFVPETAAEEIIRQLGGIKQENKETRKSETQKSETQKSETPIGEDGLTPEEKTHLAWKDKVLDKILPKR